METNLRSIKRTYRLPADLHAALVTAAARRGLTETDIVVEALEQSFIRQDGVPDTHQGMPDDLFSTPDTRPPTSGNLYAVPDTRPVVPVPGILPKMTEEQRQGEHRAWADFVHSRCLRLTAGLVGGDDDYTARQLTKEIFVAMAAATGTEMDERKLTEWLEAAAQEVGRYFLKRQQRQDRRTRWRRYLPRSWR